LLYAEQGWQGKMLMTTLLAKVYFFHFI